MQTTEFAQRLRKIMDHRDIKANELAEETGLSKATISYYMSGKTSPTGKNLDKIADALGVPTSYLLEDAEMELGEDECDLNNLPVPVAAKLLGVSQAFLRHSLRNGDAPFGWATQMTGDSYRYYISPYRFVQYTGIKPPGYDETQYAGSMLHQAIGAVRQCS